MTVVVLSSAIPVSMRRYGLLGILLNQMSSGNMRLIVIIGLTCLMTSSIRLGRDIMRWEKLFQHAKEVL